MDSRNHTIGYLEQALRAVDTAVAAVLADTDLALAGGLDRLAPFSRVLRFALANAVVTQPVPARRL